MNFKERKKTIRRKFTKKYLQELKIRFRKDW